MTKTTFNVETRKEAGRKVKQLRAEMVMPGNVYGKSGSFSIQFPSLKFDKLYAEVGETGLVYVNLDGKDERPTLVDEVQVDPVSGEVLHVSFKEVDLTQKIEAEIPVEIEGEFDVPGAVLVQVRNSIEVEALPTDLPENFVVNVEELAEIGQSITLGDLNFDKSKVTILGVESEEDLEKPIVLVQEMKEEEEPEEVDVDDVEIEGEAEGEEEKTEGETESKPEAADEGGEESADAE